MGSSLPHAHTHRHTHSLSTAPTALLRTLQVKFQVGGRPSLTFSQRCRPSLEKARTLHPDRPTDNRQQQLRGVVSVPFTISYTHTYTHSHFFIRANSFTYYKYFRVTFVHTVHTYTLTHTDYSYAHNAHYAHFSTGGSRLFVSHAVNAHLRTVRNGKWEKNIWYYFRLLSPLTAYRLH